VAIIVSDVNLSKVEEVRAFAASDACFVVGT
jgi:hypothetical protein